MVYWVRVKDAYENSAYRSTWYGHNHAPNKPCHILLDPVNVFLTLYFLTHAERRQNTADHEERVGVYHACAEYVGPFLTAHLY
jgi:hypothetical protein